MHRLLEILLQMNKCAGRLNQCLEEIMVIRIGIEPKLLEDIMGFIVTLLIPTLEIGAVKRMMFDVDLRGIDIRAHQIRDEARNPLAFVHEGLNLIAARMMSKPRGFAIPEDPESSPRNESLRMADLRDNEE